MELPHRKPNRLKGYDYSTQGIYFVTICTQNHECFFGDIVAANCVRHCKMNLSDIGFAVKHEIERVDRIYK